MPNDIPLPEDGIIGLKFFSEYERYVITPNFLVLDKKKLPLQVDGDFIPEKTSKIPDGIYKIKDGIIKVPIQNYSTKPAEIPKRIEYEEMHTICSRDLNFPKRDESWQGLQVISKSSKLEHLEPEQMEFVKKVIRKYPEVFSLDTEPLPCTNLTEHEIVLKTGKIINLRSHKLPQKHREFALQETEKLLNKYKKISKSFRSIMSIIRRAYHSPW